MIDEHRTGAAARYLASRCRLARMEAVRRSAAVALRFQHDGGVVRYATVIDGNHNGVRTVEITRGVDRLLTEYERIDGLFPGVSFGFVNEAVPIGSDAPDGDPLQIGRSEIVTFAPDGGATSGTLYLRGRSSVQFAVRVLGLTGRTRVLRFDVRTRSWSQR
jgi:hypothetical protein